ncbi:MAG: response regulator, partial [Halapricum sp.]
MPDADAVSVLYVDPDEQRRLEAATDLEISPVLDATVETCDCVGDATDVLESSTVDCLVTAYELPDGTGLDLVAWVRDHQPDLTCILYTDTTPEAIRTAEFEDVVVEYLPRAIPDAVTALARLIDNSVRQRSQLAYPISETEDERIAALHEEYRQAQREDPADQRTRMLLDEMEAAGAELWLRT